eukprot:scaffold102905_cov69-Phaeocystis_antarctica.AAC.1
MYHGARGARANSSGRTSSTSARPMAATSSAIASRRRGVPPRVHACVPVLHVCVPVCVTLRARVRVRACGRRAAREGLLALRLSENATSTKRKRWWHDFVLSEDRQTLAAELQIFL